MSTRPVTVSVASLVTIGPAAPVADLGEPERVRVLVRAAQAGERAAFGTLVEMHERAVFRTALAALGDAGEADDTAQEAFVIAWQRLSGFRHEASFRTWLLTITWRKALDRRRRQRRWWSRAASPDAGAGTAPVDRLESASADPERQAVAGDLLRKARAEIVRLSPKLRDTLLLASSGEHSYEQIATLQGIPLGTVKWRVAEARRQLTRRLGDRPGGPR